MNIYKEIREVRSGIMSGEPFARDGTLRNCGPPGSFFESTFLQYKEMDDPGGDYG